MRHGVLKVSRAFQRAPALSRGRALGGVLGVVGFFLLMIAAAQLRIPVPGTEVPMTLQLLAVLLTGFALTPPRAVAAMVLYLACGAAGLPVFAAGSAGLAGSTGGYIAGFVVAAALVSTLKGDRNASFGRLLAAGAAGVVAVFVLGIAWRVLLVLLLDRLDGGVWIAVTSGLVPFVGKAFIELLLAVMLVVAVRGGLIRGGRL